MDDGERPAGKREGDAAGMASIRAVAVVRRQQYKHFAEQIRIAAGRAR